MLSGATIEKLWSQAIADAAADPNGGGDVFRFARLVEARVLRNEVRRIIEYVRERETKEERDA